MRTMYDKPIKGVTTYSNYDVEVIGESSVYRDNGTVEEYYLYNICDYSGNEQPFVTLKKEIKLIHELSLERMSSIVERLNKETKNFAFLESDGNDSIEKGVYYIGVCNDIESDAYIYAIKNKTYYVVDNSMNVTIKNYEDAVQHLEKSGFTRN